MQFLQLQVHAVKPEKYEQSDLLYNVQNDIVINLYLHVDKLHIQ